MITTAHAHKSGVIFHFFPRAFKQKKFKALRPKMTKIASRGGGPLNGVASLLVVTARVTIRDIKESSNSNKASAKLSGLM